MQQLAEAKKENDFLKKQRHSLRRKLMSDLSIHYKIQKLLWTAMVALRMEFLPMPITAT